MKSIAIAAVLFLFAAATCRAQVGVLGIDGTGAGKRFEDFKQEGDFGPIEKKPVARPDLLSADDRWSPAKKGEYAGTLAVKKPPAFKVGDWGCLSLTFRVLSKVDEAECLAVPKFRNAEPVLLRGFDVSKAADGTEFVLRHPVVIQETYEISSADGGKRSVLVLDRSRFDTFYAAMQKSEQAQDAAANGQVRAWTDVKGNPVATSARFVEFKDNQVHLERTDDGSKIEIGMVALSPEDRQWIREELKRRREKE